MWVQIESGAAGKAGGVAPKRVVMWWAVRPLAAEGKVRVERPENGERGFGWLLLHLSGLVELPMWGLLAIA